MDNQKIRQNDNNTNNNNKSNYKTTHNKMSLIHFFLVYKTIYLIDVQGCETNKHRKMKQDNSS